MKLYLRGQSQPNIIPIFHGNKYVKFIQIEGLKLDDKENDVIIYGRNYDVLFHLQAERFSSVMPKSLEIEYPGINGYDVDIRVIKGDCWVDLKMADRSHPKIMKVFKNVGKFITMNQLSHRCNIPGESFVTLIANFGEDNGPAIEREGITINGDKSHTNSVFKEASNSNLMYITNGEEAKVYEMGDSHKINFSDMDKSIVIPACNLDIMPFVIFNREVTTLYVVYEVYK